MKRLFIFLVLLVLRLNTSLAADYYVRPSGGSYGDEDGSSYATAWDGFTNINWQTVDEGNGKLFVAGTHNEQMTIGASGEDSTPIHIISCITANGASTDDAGTIDGQNTRDYGILIADANPDHSNIIINNSAGNTAQPNGDIRFSSGALVLDALGQVVNRTVQTDRYEKMIIATIQKPEALIPEGELRILQNADPVFRDRFKSD